MVGVECDPDGTVAVGAKVGEHEERFVQTQWHSERPPNSLVERGSVVVGVLKNSTKQEW